MKLEIRIEYVEDYGYKKTLNFEGIGSSFQGHITINEGHDWFDLQPDDRLTISL